MPSNRGIDSARRKNSEYATAKHVQNTQNLFVVCSLLFICWESVSLREISDSSHDMIARPSAVAMRPLVNYLRQDYSGRVVCFPKWHSITIFATARGCFLSTLMVTATVSMSYRAKNKVAQIRVRHMGVAACERQFVLWLLREARVSRRRLQVAHYCRCIPRASRSTPHHVDHLYNHRCDT